MQELRLGRCQMVSNPVKGRDSSMDEQATEELVANMKSCPAAKLLWSWSAECVMRTAYFYLRTQAVQFLMDHCEPKPTEAPRAQSKRKKSTSGTGLAALKAELGKEGKEDDGGSLHSDDEIASDGDDSEGSPKLNSTGTPAKRAAAAPQEFKRRASAACVIMCPFAFLCRLSMKNRHVWQWPFRTFLGTAFHEAVPPERRVPCGSKCRWWRHLGRRAALQRSCQGCAGWERRMSVLLPAVAGCIC